MLFEGFADGDLGEWEDEDRPQDNPDGCPFVAAWLMAKVGAVVFVISWMLRRNKRER
jgi:hypothetical protein